MEDWDKVIHDFGTIKAGAKVRCAFKFISKDKEIVNLFTTCGCTKAEYNKKKKTVEVTYTSKGFPPQVTAPVQYVSQYIHVNYTDGTTEVLSLKGKKIRR